MASKTTAVGRSASTSREGKSRRLVPNSAEVAALAPVTAIINWVEKGQAPETILASKVVDGKVTRTRPLCAYPQVARYKGTGSIDDAANFSCVKP